VCRRLLPTRPPRPLLHHDRLLPAVHLPPLRAAGVSARRRRHVVHDASGGRLVRTSRAAGAGTVASIPTIATARRVSQTQTRCTRAVRPTMVAMAAEETGGIPAVRASLLQLQLARPVRSLPV